MKQRVLVVDDDSQYRELLKHWLEFEGHEAILAENLEDGFVAIAAYAVAGRRAAGYSFGEEERADAGSLGSQAETSGASADRRGHGFSLVQGFEEYRRSRLRYLLHETH